MRLSFQIFAFAGLLWTAPCWAEDHVEYNRDIRPILSDNCFFCHGFDEESREAGLRLDTFAGATDAAIVPGKPAESELLRRLLSKDEAEVMPPPESEKQLSAEEIELVRRWIQQGAEYQEHWAWRPLVRPQAPTGSKAIDSLLADGWKEQNAQPAARAKPRELLRRLSFDLRGLPPTNAEVVRFQQDPSQEAFLQLRDQWMADPTYAEHQAVRWLDLVRWADTSGFVSDEPIASGAYRAWIIHAIGKNIPFDEFSIAQLAGDLLPDPTDDQLTASGYNRIVNTNCEAGGIEEEQLYKLKGEHVRAVGTVWLGMTTGCAECHDHKFDPFSAKDYYSLAAFFDDLVEAGVYTPGDRREPLHYVHDDMRDAGRDRKLAAKIRELSKKIAAKPIAEIESWEQEAVAILKDTDSRTEFVWLPAELPAARVIEGDFEIATVEGRRARRTTSDGGLSRHHVAELMTGWLKLAGQKTDAAKDAVFVDAWIDPENRPTMIGVQVSHGMYGRLGWQTANYETYYWGSDASEVLGQEQPWSEPKRVQHLGDIPSESGWVRLRIPFEKLVPPGKSTYESVGMAWMHVGGQVGWGDSGLDIRTDKTGRLRLGEVGMRKWWELPMNRQFFQKRVSLPVDALLAKPDSRSDLQKELVIDAYREMTQPQLMKKLRAMESKLFRMRANAMPVLVSRPADQPKLTRLVNRGDYQDTTGPIMKAALPEFLVNDSTDRKLTRLDLAKWLFDKDNPLVARVFVNRLWHQFYGRGLSETLEDAGTQGDWPSNVALLDWLACEFRDSGWNRNHMIRLLTEAKAYSLSSKPSPDLAQRDPGNRWHARQGRFRMTAETIRDSTLLAAGLLNLTSEVPIDSFFPYQPKPYWARSDKVMYGSRHLVWDTSQERTQYNRSLYTFWKRQNIHPTMLVFDAPTRQECTAKRNITNTPGQALALLNDPTFVEAARVMAMRICEQPNLSDIERIESAYQTALQRTPTEEEIRILEGTLASQRIRFASDKQSAVELTSIGQAAAPAQSRVSEIAAWTMLTRTILNLHEFLNRP